MGFDLKNIVVLEGEVARIRCLDSSFRVVDTLIDVADVEKVREHKWRLNEFDGAFYLVASIPLTAGELRKRNARRKRDSTKDKPLKQLRRLSRTSEPYGAHVDRWRLARFLLRPPRGSRIDFRNGDPLDCRRENIAVISPKILRVEKKQGRVKSKSFVVDDFWAAYFQSSPRHTPENRLSAPGKHGIPGLSFVKHGAGSRWKISGKLRGRAKAKVFSTPAAARTWYDKMIAYCENISAPRTGRVSRSRTVPPSGNETVVRGVTFSKAHNRWRAQTVRNGKYYEKRCDTYEEAVAARSRMDLEFSLFGEIG